MEMRDPDARIKAGQAFPVPDGNRMTQKNQIEITRLKVMDRLFK